MNKPIIASAFAGLVALAAGSASAAQYTFEFATEQALFGGPVMGSGVFTTSDTAMTIGGRTAYAVTAIDGTFNGSAITKPTLSTYGNYFVDGPAFLDGSGVRFDTSTTTNVALFFQDTVGRYRVNAINQGRSSYVSASSMAVTAGVPEPATWAMLVLGFGALGFAQRRGKRWRARLRLA